MAKKVITTIRGQIYEILKESICAGEYKPGQWLQEKELAEQYSVSRSPVREALRQLTSDGLVIDIPNKGVFVREFTPKDIEEIFDMRVILESYAIEQLCGQNSTEFKKPIQECLQDLVSAYRQDNHDLYIKYDRLLHNKIIELSGNSLLVAAYERVSIMVQQFRAYSLIDPVRFRDSMQEHSDLVKFILERNSQEAIQVNNSHLYLAKEQIILYLNEYKNS